MIEVLNSGSSASPITLTTGGTLYWVARIDGVSGKVHKLKYIDAWIDNAANTDGTWELVIARCATANVDTEWAAITSQKWNSASVAAVSAAVYIPSGGTPSPTSVTRLANYGGISYASKFKQLFNLEINASETFLIGIQHPVNSRSARWTIEIETP